ncbi:hypothetical protein LAUMK142_04877 [Mycobacterium pseudokansasii]|uniref:Tox-REase-5 domain-containing protein n=2 Tax=Mycobacterium pseudokansasii TaxID=2341080 RepID=A0A498QXX2_9MYCO|nr:hypothetical protein LAUMK142_04877 [Mycobacterium pseudokansasii]
MATLSQVRAWSTEHLIEAAGYWTRTADQWEDVFLRMRNQSHTLVWEGAGGDALRQRTGADFAVVSAKAEQLRQASKIARDGAGTIGAAQRRVLFAIEDAHNAGFAVAEDFSVTDTRTSRSAAEQVARQAQAHAFAADIRQRVAQLLGVEHDVAGKITAATAGIAATTFPETPHDPKPRIQAVDNHTFKDSPQQPQPPGDPARMTPEQARAAYDQLKGEIRDHNSWRPPLDDASAVATYNREADALNARKGALEAQLGKTETVPAQGTRLVPDWAQPWQPPAHSPTPIPHGPGTWQPVTESMSDRAAQYQMQITGHPVTEGYIVDGVKFDGFTDGALIEVKSYYDQFTENGHWRPWFNGEQGILNQAYNQIRVAGTTPIEWVFAQPETAALVEDLLTRNGYAINVIVVPPK